jgi:hypothetical protein
MAWTVALTVVFGVIIFVLGQLVVSLIIEPAQNLRRTIAAISHALIERANVIQDGGLSTKAVMDETSAELRKLSSQLQSRFYMVPLYRITASVFRLPAAEKIRAASGALIGLSNSIVQSRESVYKINSKRVQIVCDSLGIYLDEENRWPKGET